MDKIGKQLKENVTNYANKLPPEIVGRFLQKLSVGDRLKSEGVSPLWKRTLSKWGWSEQRKLDASIVFEGESRESIGRFWIPLNDGSFHLASLLHQCGPWLRELDLPSFGLGNIEQFLPQIAESLSSLKKLENLDIRGFYLGDFVEHLPPNLRLLTVTYGVSIETLEALSVRCPNLEEVPFQFVIYNNNELDAETMIELIGKFPRQRKLNLHWLFFPAGKVGALAPIAELKELEELDVHHSYCLDGASLEAIVEGCKRLRSFSFDTNLFSEQALFKLAKMPNLVALDVRGQIGGKFTDAVLKAIAQRGQLKKLVVDGIYGEDHTSFTEDSIVYLVDRCKSLVSLNLHYCLKITERSLEAIVAEIERRHGSPPRSFPNGPMDPGVFYFYYDWNPEGHILDRARELIGDNPWIRIDSDDRRELI